MQSWTTNGPGPRSGRLPRRIVGMTPPHARALAAALLAAAAATGCSGAPRAAPQDVPAPAAAGAPAAPAAAEQGDRAAIARARADSARLPYTEADVHFMSAMIGHHAQAITMARLAPTHGASATIRTLAGRVVNAQQDEIALMQQWLRDRQQPVPEPDTAGPGAARPSAGHGEGHAGHDMATHDMPMPGMLT